MVHLKNERIKRFNAAASQMGERALLLLKGIDEGLKENAQEIRLRLGVDISITIQTGQTYLPMLGKVSRELLDEVFISLCKHSVYSRQNEIANGYISLEGGHRAGITGTAVISGGRVTSVRDVTSICVRIAREFPRCSASVMPLLGDLSGGILLAGAPSSGKTTMLRDIALSLSEGVLGKRVRVSLIDSRGELSGAAGGEISARLGCSCDVYVGYPKSTAMEQAIRTMSPEVIICDEIGGVEDARAASMCLNSGVCVVASIHASCKRELLNRPSAQLLLRSGAFRYVVFLGRKPCEIQAIEETEVLLREAICSGSGDAGFFPVWNRYDARPEGEIPLAV